MRKNKGSQAPLHPGLCVLLVIILGLFCPVNLRSQTLVKLMAPQAAQLQINLEDQQCFGDAVQFTLGSEAYVSGGTSPYNYEWTFNSTFFSNEASILVTPLQNDVYSLTVSDSLGCTTEKDIWLKIVAGTDKLLEEYLTIYPNPAKDYIHIAIPGDPLRFTGVIYNSLGISVWRGEVGNNSIVPLHHPPGYYILQLKNGQETVEKKIIIR